MVIVLAYVLIENIDHYLYLILPDYVQPILNWYEDNFVERINKKVNGRSVECIQHVTTKILFQVNLISKSMQAKAMNLINGSNMLKSVLDCIKH